MGTVQRYVSDELTHFVGRGRSEEDQFDLLLHILQSGRLLPAPEEGGVDGDLVIDLQAPVSGNEAYCPEAVCFCDIPVGDLDIHIRKYSAFGIAFRKPFVVERGATPMFYVAARSRTWAPSAPGEAPRPLARADAFDEQVRAYQRLRDEAHHRAATLPPGPERDFHERFLRLAHFLDFEVLSFLKMFDYPTADEDPENYYMEREWRLLGPLEFSHPDVRRVILPESYAARFRKAFPDYAGQVTFGSAGSG